MRKIITATAITVAAFTLGGCYRTGPIPIRPHPETHTPGTAPQPEHTPGTAPPSCPNGYRPIGWLPDGVTLDCVPA